MKLHFLLYGHGGSYNHGAEAIVKCTISEIRKQFPNSHISLSSNFSEQDKELNVPANEFFAPDKELWLKEKAASETQKHFYASLMYGDALSTITSETTLYSVGGDNFCYPNWHRLAVFQRKATEKNAKSVLWSCSIEPSEISSDMVQVLNSYDVITARESITYNALKERGITAEISLVRDVAFILEPESVIMPAPFRYKNFVGINVSPLVIRKEPIIGIVIQNFLSLIEFIIAHTDKNIALLPHVVMPMDNDNDILMEIFEALPDKLKSRVWLVSDSFSAAQYKYVISCASALVCCRTHASIAAYSSNVPCIVVGYSVKSAGIALDLGFKDMVINIDEIKNVDDLTILFKTLIVRTAGF